MTRSMTAFARKSDEQEWGTLVWEIRSVNHRYLDVTVRLPEDLRSIEMQVREQVAERIKRGKLECTLRFTPSMAHVSEIVINEKFAKAVVAACKKVDAQSHQPNEINPMEVLRWPGVVEERKPDMQPVIAAALKLLEQTVAELVDSREREGQRLQEIILQRNQGVQNIVRDLQTRVPELISAYREKLMNRIEELKATPDMDRFEQELAYIAQKMDVDEELDRLQCHVNEVTQIFDRDEPVGRRLDFLMQEFNREANTLGSKSIDISTTQASVELKVLIEQMREQVQNIE